MLNLVEIVHLTHTTNRNLGLKQIRDATKGQGNNAGSCFFYEPDTEWKQQLASEGYICTWNKSSTLLNIM